MKAAFRKPPSKADLARTRTKTGRDHLVQFTKLRLAGFKSFVDPTELTIEPGLTGIVGPNGCGKSNLVEALRWVMGETSRQAHARRRDGRRDLRRHRQPPGAQHRRGARCSLDNADRRRPRSSTTRTSSRSRAASSAATGSAYRVNGREVRARDVQLLFADAATGAHSTGAGEPGPHRRHHRRQADRPARACWKRRPASPASIRAGTRRSCRLRAAEANLARLDDVIVTLEAQLAALKKQARQAQRYRNLQRAYPPRRGDAAPPAMAGAAAARERPPRQR